MKSLRYPLAFVAVVLFAVESWSLDLIGYQQMAIKNRPLVENQLRALEARETDIGLAQAAYNPIVSLSYTANMLDEDTGFEDERNSVVTGAVAWNLFRGFRDANSVEMAELMTEVEELRLAGVKQDVALDVALRYLGIFTNRARLEVERDATATLKKLHADGVNRYELGLIKKNDLLKFKVDLDNAEIATRRAEAQVSKSVRSLARAVGVHVSLDEVSFSEFDELPGLVVVTDREKYVELMLIHRSELLTLAKLEDAAGVNVDLERSSYYPSVDLAVSYSNYDDDYANPVYGEEEEELRGTLSLSFDIYDGGRKRLKVTRAELDAKRYLYERLELENQLRATLDNLFYDYGVGLENAEVALASIEQAEENLRITELSYKEGLSTESDLLDATENLTRAKFNYVAAKSKVFADYYLILRAVEGFHGG